MVLTSVTTLDSKRSTAKINAVFTQVVDQYDNRQFLKSNNISRERERKKSIS